MSPPDWSSIDLELYSVICARISRYSDHLEPHLQGLLDKYQILGKKLDDLSRRLRESSTQYHDLDLEKHLHQAERDFQTRRPAGNEQNAGLTSRILRPWRKKDNELTATRIKELHFEVDAHIDTAERSRTEFLFDHTYPKLKNILEELLQQGQRQSATSRTTDTDAINPSERASHPHNTQSSPSVLLSIGNDDADILAHTPTAVQLARIIWNSGAEALDLDQPRPGPNHSSSADAVIARKDKHILAKEKFLNDVLSLIEETQLDDLGVSTGGLSRAVLDRLAGIVSQAAKLKNTLPSPEIGALRTSIRPPPRETQQSDMPAPPVAAPVNVNGRVQIPTPPHTDSSSSSPQAIGKALTVPRKPLPPPSNPLSPPITGAIAPVDDSAGPSGLVGPRQEVDHPESSSSSEFPSIGSPAMSSSDSGSPIVRGVERETPFPHPSAVAMGKQPAREPTREQGAAHDQASSSSGWTKISSLEAGITPSFCTLEVASFNDRLFLLAVVTTDLVPAPSAEGSLQRTWSESTPTSHIDHTDRTHPFPNARRFEHLILQDTRPMPSVIYPAYEGPAYRPETPYTITFTETQSLCERKHNPRPQLVSDLSYIFSSKAERDRIRSILFGKRLLLHAGVHSIMFDYIACQLEAVSLWEEEDATTKPRTITFNRNSSASRSRLHGEVEYEIVVRRSFKKYLEANKPLKLTVRQVAGAGLRERASSEEKDCRLFFSRSDEKAAFISILNPPHPQA